MLDSADLLQLRGLLEEAVDDVDADLVDAIRRNAGEFGSREQLLAELDVLEKVRSALNVRFERITAAARNRAAGNE